MSSGWLKNYMLLLSKEKQLGDTYVIIDSKWFEHWKRSVGIEKTEEEKVTDPGPIDFTHLALPDTHDHAAKVQLRPDVFEGNDFTFIPYDLYNELREKHTKIGPEIIRQVIPSGQCDTVIEAFLVPLRLRESRSVKAKTKQIYLSRRTLIDDLKKEISNEYPVSSNFNHRLLASTDDNCTDWEPIDDRPGLVLEDVDLTKNAFIIFESKSMSTRSGGSALSFRTNYIPGLYGLSKV